MRLHSINVVGAITMSEALDTAAGELLEHIAKEENSIKSP